MSIAVRLTKLDNSGNDIGHIDFGRKEILDSEVFPFIDSRIARAQNGAPTLIIASDEYHIIKIDFRIHGTVTEGKLTGLRNFILAGGVVRVFPKWYDDPSVYYDCIVRPETLQLISAFSGQSRAGKKLSIEFLETTQASQYVVDDEIVIE